MNETTTNLKALTDNELRDLFQGVLTEIRERPMAFRHAAQQVINYCCRHQSLLRLKIGVNEWAAFWRGAQGK